MPNVSAWQVPKIPEVFKSLVEEENRKFLLSTKEHDNFHAKTEEIFLFPDQGEKYAFHTVIVQ